jgi:ketosteroid isomerase-like protein
MAAQENADRIRGAYEAFGRGDVGYLVELFHEDIVWHYPGTSVLSGDHAGRDDVLGGLLGQFAPRSGGTYRAELLQVMGGDDFVAGWARDTATRQGAALDVKAVVVYELRGGKVVEAWHHFDDIAALDTFWSGT